MNANRRYYCDLGNKDVIHKLAGMYSRLHSQHCGTLSTYKWSNILAGYYTIHSRKMSKSQNPQNNQKVTATQTWLIRLKAPKQEKKVFWEQNCEVNRSVQVTSSTNVVTMTVQTLPSMFTLWRRTCSRSLCIHSAGWTASPSAVPQKENDRSTSCCIN